MKYPEIKEGHGLESVSCEHGSRWEWWQDMKQWYRVIYAPNCDCDNPPFPYKEREQFCCDALEKFGHCACESFEHLKEREQ